MSRVILLSLRRLRECLLGLVRRAGRLLDRPVVSYVAAVAPPSSALSDVLPDPVGYGVDLSIHARPEGLRLGMLIPDCYCPVCGTQAMREGRCNAEEVWDGTPSWFLRCAACQETFQAEEMELYGEFVAWRMEGCQGRGLPAFLLQAFEDLRRLQDPYVVLRRRLCQREPALSQVPAVAEPAPFARAS